MRRWNRKITTTLVVFVILVLGLDLSPWGRIVTRPIGRDIGLWFQGPIQKYQTFLGDATSLRDMYRQNKQLTTQMQNYALLQARLADVESENTRMQTMISFERNLKTGWHLVPAHVVGRAVSTWNDEFTIDVGSASQIGTNMAVISPEGYLVGRVMSVTADTSTVAFVTGSQNSDGVSASVQDGSNQYAGIAVSSSLQNNMLNLEFLSPLAHLKPGDVVTTSGIGSHFPKGIIIGKVLTESAGAQGLTRTAVVKPSADVESLEDVFVITN